MTQNTVVVAGDRFTEFHAQRSVVPVSELLRQAAAGELTTDTEVVVGLGIPATETDRLLALADQGAIRLRDRPADPAGRRLTHKHHVKNMMIGTPVRVGPETFEADLVVDEFGEMLEDHLTGQHIPGIALTEAARQTWTAVTEEFLLTETSGAQRFVLAEVNSTFHRYVFPMPARARYVLRDRSRGPLGEVFTCRVEIIQQDTVCVVVEAQYRLVPEVFARKHEALGARSAVAAELSARSTALARTGGDR